MGNKLPYRLGVLAPGDPDDIRTWSGIPYFMTNALRSRFREAIYLPAGSLCFSKSGVRLNRWSHRLFGRCYVPGLGRRHLARRACAVDELIKIHKVDAVFSITVDQLVAFLKTEVPLIHHSDATFAALEGYYPEYSSIWGFCQARGNEYSSRTLARSDLSIYPTQWAAHSAIEAYGADPAKVHVVPYGANLATPPAAEDVLQLEQRRYSCQLLFIGSQWKRKGGETVFATLLELIDRGIDARLVIVGCDPMVTHDRMTVIPFLNKQVPADYKRYLDLLRKSTFLFIPSQQETFGAVFAEAAANALPVISRHTGGIAEVVEHGVSGYLLPEEASPQAYADVIEQTWAVTERYQALMKGARDRFEHILNWDRWARCTSSLIETIITKRRRWPANSSFPTGPPRRPPSPVSRAASPSPTARCS